MKYVYPVLVGLFIGLAVIIIINPHDRYRGEGGELYKATFIQLPGIEESQDFDHVIQLKHYVDSRLSMEAQLAAEIDMEALFRAGDFVNDEYVREMDDDGHWLLRKPGKINRYFSLSANYRISPWVLHHPGEK